MSRAAHGQLLLQRCHRPRCEQPRHQLAQPGVLGRVVVDQQCLGEVELFGGHPFGQAHHGALGVGRPHRAAVAGDGLDVLVAGDHPVAAVIEDRLVLLVPPHRRGLAQFGELTAPGFRGAGRRDR